MSINDYIEIRTGKEDKGWSFQTTALCFKLWYPKHLSVQLRRFALLLQYFNTIESAISYAEEELRQNVLIMVHSGVYKTELLVIDSNVTILGAGESVDFTFVQCISVLNS